MLDLIWDHYLGWLIVLALTWYIELLLFIGVFMFWYQENYTYIHCGTVDSGSAIGDSVAEQMALI